MSTQQRMTTTEEVHGGLARERIIEEDTQPISQNDTILKVAARSRPTATAGAIAGVVRSGGSALIQAVGAGAVNQAVKAVAIAQMYLSAEGLDIVCVPFFLDVAIEEQERTAVCLRIELRSSIAS